MMKKSLVLFLLSVFLFGRTIELEPIEVLESVEKKEDVWIDLSCQNNWITQKVNCTKILSESRHEMTFEKAKCEYLRDKEISIRDISGSRFYYNEIFELPEEKQCHYYEVWTEDSWEEAGVIMQQESAIANEGVRRLNDEKPDRSYNKYIRSAKEVEAIFQSRKVPKPKKRCFLGVGSACVDEGFRKKDAIRYFKKGCALKDGLSCSYLACSYLNGWDVEQDRDQAWRLWKKACHLGDGSACLQLGIRCFRAKQREKAAGYFKEGCRKGDHFACIWLKEYGFK